MVDEPRKSALVPVGIVGYGRLVRIPHKGSPMEHIRVFVSTDRRTTPGPGQSAVYACRHCRDAVKVAGIRYLPEVCPGCGISTWDADGQCANFEQCTAARRPGIRGRSHCAACGYSIWTLVGVEEDSRLWPSAPTLQ